jgi:hypothetical protein
MFARLSFRFLALGLWAVALAGPLRFAERGNREPGESGASV